MPGVAGDIICKQMDGGDGAKKRMVDEMGFSSGTDAIADDKKQRLEEDSQFSDDKIEKMDAGDGAKKRMVDEMGFRSGTDAIADDKIDVGDVAKKNMADGMGFSSGTSTIPDDKKQRIIEDSQFSDEKIEKACQLPTPQMPHCLPSVVIDAPGAGTVEPAPDTLLPQGGVGLGLASVDTCAPGAGVDEPVAHVVVPHQVVCGSVKLPSVQPDAPGTGGDDSSELEVDGLPSAESNAPGAGELPCVEPGAPGAGGEASSECELEGYGSLGEDDVDINCYSQPQSPTRDLKSAKEVNIPRLS